MAATITAAQPAPIIFVADSFGSNAALRKVQPNGTGRVTMTGITASNLEQSLPRWAPGRVRAAFTAFNGNFNGLWITNAAGDSSANYVSDADAFRGMLELVYCLAFPEEVMARPQVAAAVAAAEVGPPRLMGPDRGALLELVG